MVAIVETYGNMLLGALGKTLLLALLSLLFAVVIGMIFALMNVGRNRIMNLIGTVYVDAVRGVPLIVLAYFIATNEPYIINLGYFSKYDDINVTPSDIEKLVKILNEDFEGITPDDIKSSDSLMNQMLALSSYVSF